MKKSVCVAACVVLVAAAYLIPVRSADAYTAFSKAFQGKYAADKSTDVQKSLDKEFARVKCAVCHDPRPGEKGKASKKNRNPYGAALNKHLTKKDQKDSDKIVAALAKVETEKAEGAEKTFGELLTAGKLPFLYEGFDYAGTKEEPKDGE